MKLEMSGSQHFDAPPEAVWAAVNDPAVLVRAIPGCETMEEIETGVYRIGLSLRVASVGGTLEGEIALVDPRPPETCAIRVSGEGTLGFGTGTATFTLAPEPGGRTRLDWSGEGEAGGLVAGVGQRVLKGVARHLVATFFKSLKRVMEADHASAAVHSA